MLKIVSQPKHLQFHKLLMTKHLFPKKSDLTRKTNLVLLSNKYLFNSLALEYESAKRITPLALRIK